MEIGDFDLAKFHFHASHFDFNFTSNIVLAAKEADFAALFFVNSTLLQVYFGCIFVGECR